MRWIKIETTIRRNPKLIKAGWKACFVYEGLLQLNGLHDFDGRIPEHYTEPHFLSVEWQCPIDVIEPGLTACFQFGLVTNDDKKSLIISGWGDIWSAYQTSTERVRQFRQKHNETHSTNENDSGCNSETLYETLETMKRTKNVPKRTSETHSSTENISECNDETNETPKSRVDKIRVDKRREEKRRREKKHTRTSRSAKASLGVFDLEAIYSHYPQKLGKTQGMKRLRAVIKSQDDYTDFCNAVLNYAAASSGKDAQYIAHFSTFCADRWRDWVDGNPNKKTGNGHHLDPDKPLSDTQFAELAQALRERDL